jgi:hypothetical protein
MALAPDAPATEQQKIASLETIGYICEGVVSNLSLSLCLCFYDCCLKPYLLM